MCPIGPPRLRSNNTATLQFKSANSTSGQYNSGKIPRTESDLRCIANSMPNCISIVRSRPPTHFLDTPLPASYCRSGFTVGDTSVTEFLSGNTCVVGLQWGDEGKGKIVDFLTEHADVVVRYCGGANAGHTVRIGQEKYATHLLPVGVFRPA